MALNRHFKIIVLLACFTAIAIGVMADQKLVYKFDNAEFRGKEANSGTIEISVSPTLGVRYEVKDAWAILYSASTAEMYVLFPGQSQWAKVNYLRLNDYHAEDIEQLEEVDVETEETSETVKIHDWDSKKWVFTVENELYESTIDAYYTQEIPVSAMLDEFYAELSTIKGPLGNVNEAIRSVAGILVKRVETAVIEETQYKFSLELVSAEELELPTTLYDVPEETTNEIELSIDQFRRIFM